MTDLQTKVLEKLKKAMNLRGFAATTRKSYINHLSLLFKHYNNKFCFKLFGAEYTIPRIVKCVLECPHCGCEMKFVSSVKLKFDGS